MDSDIGHPIGEARKNEITEHKGEKEKASLMATVRCMGKRVTSESGRQRSAAKGKLGCYLMILVKRWQHYTIGLDPESRSVTDRERC